MAVSHGHTDVTIQEILSKVSEAEILHFYLGISKIPCVICSPLRRDRNPSFGFYTKNGSKIHFMDYATRESGGIFDLLTKMWHCTLNDAISTILKDIPKMTNNVSIYTSSSKGTAVASVVNVSLRCKIRKWKDYDIAYWENYGVPLKWLQFAEVYPISHVFYVYNNREVVISADKFAYCFVEHKEGNTTIKIYQPFNVEGYKWRTTHDSSVVGLWTKVPQYGEEVCICSSVKDALCLWANIGIPSLCLQGEGYKMSRTAINELKRRFNKVYVCFDNDPPGIENAQKFTQDTGFINVVLPQFEGGKDISDLYKANGLKMFINIVSELFHPTQKEWEDILPF